MKLFKYFFIVTTLCIQTTFAATAIEELDSLINNIAHTTSPRQLEEKTRELVLKINALEGEEREQAIAYLQNLETLTFNTMEQMIVDCNDPDLKETLIGIYNKMVKDKHREAKKSALYALCSTIVCGSLIAVIKTTMGQDLNEANFRTNMFIYMASLVGALFSGIVSITNTVGLLVHLSNLRAVEIVEMPRAPAKSRQPLHN